MKSQNMWAGTKQQRNEIQVYLLWKTGKAKLYEREHNNRNEKPTRRLPDLSMSNTADVLYDIRIVYPS